MYGMVECRRVRERYHVGFLGASVVKVEMPSDKRKTRLIYALTTLTVN